jgi:hypothetical protein
VTGRARVEAAQRAEMSEDDWQKRVMDFMRLHRWRVVHIRNVRVDGRWRVPYQGDGGLLDLIAARDDRVILVELKADKPAPFKPGQREWLAAAGVNGYCWQPSDWPEVQEVLR